MNPADESLNEEFQEYLTDKKLRPVFEEDPNWYAYQESVNMVGLMTSNIPYSNSQRIFMTL